MTSRLTAKDTREAVTRLRLGNAADLGRMLTAVRAERDAALGRMVGGSVEPNQLLHLQGYVKALSSVVQMLSATPSTAPAVEAGEPTPE